MREGNVLPKLSNVIETRKCFGQTWKRFLTTKKRSHERRKRFAQTWKRYAITKKRSP